MTNRQLIKHTLTSAQHKHKINYLHYIVVSIHVSSELHTSVEVGNKGFRNEVKSHCRGGRPEVQVS